MLKKLVPITLLILLIVSCSNDDGNNPTDPNTGNEGSTSISFPNSTTQWDPGYHNKVVWDPSVFDDNAFLVISLYRGVDSITTLTFYIPNDGEDSVYVPEDIEPGDNYRLKIYDFIKPSVFVYSNSFKVKAYQQKNRPVAVYPADSSTVAAEVTFQWKIENSDNSDLRFNLYVSEYNDTRPRLVASDLDVATYQHNVGYGVLFFWYVEVIEPNGNRITSKEYRFRSGYGNYNVDVPMKIIPAGDFTLGENNETWNLSYEYEISTTEITNGVYAEWLNRLVSAKVELEKKNAPTGLYFHEEDDTSINTYIPEGRYQLLGFNASIGWNDSSEAFGVEYGALREPVNDVSWYGAKIYAQDRGYKLPTKYEWEKAARGMSGNTYPWGNSGPVCGNVNFADCGFGLKEVGSFPGYNAHSTAGDLFDMAGNVWEWTESNGAPPNNFQFVPIVKGGAFNSQPDDLKTYNQREVITTATQSNIGFRVVKVAKRE